MVRPDSLVLPDFLGIGAQKAGTTWLWENLRRHPEVFIPERKEVHYFDLNFHRPLGWYADYFRPESGQICGEITPAYSVLSPDLVRHVRRLMPELRLVYMMRNPIDRAWSHAMMNLVTRTGRCVDEVPQSEVLDHFRSASSLGKGDILTTVETWTRVFPEDRLLVRPFESIADDPAGLMRDVFAHLGVATEVDWADFALHDRIFAGGGVPVPEAYRGFLHDLYGDDIERLHARFGSLVEAWRV